MQTEPTNRVIALRDPMSKTCVFKLLPEGKLCGDTTFSRWEHVKNDVHLFDAKDKRTCVIELTECPRVDAFHARLNGLRMLAVDCTDTFRLPPKKRFEVVVSKYKENTGWTECIEENVTLYNKGPEPGGIPLPNHGREAGTYLWHIVSRWDSLADRTLFVQGSPWEHPMLPLSVFANDPQPFVGVANLVRSFSADTFVTRYGKEAWWRQYVQTPMPSHVLYGYGAQFAVDRELVRRRGKAYWEDLYALSVMASVHLGDAMLDNYAIAVMFEHTWPYIFNFRGEPVSGPVLMPKIEPPVPCNNSLVLWREELRLGRYGHGVEF